MSRNGHLGGVCANGVNTQGHAVEWVVVCVTKGCGFEVGPSGDLTLMHEIWDQHRDESRRPRDA